MFYTHYLHCFGTNKNIRIVYLYINIENVRIKIAARLTTCTLEFEQFYKQIMDRNNDFSS